MDAARHSPLASELMSARAVRERCTELLRLADADALDGFRIQRERLAPVAKQVAELTLERFPDLDIPFHSRWRHFQIHGEDRWAAIAADLDREQRLKAAFDLVVVSVLLDAGAGPHWRYLEPAHGQRVGRSEGLALASLDMFAAGLFSSDPGQPLRADGDGLRCLDLRALARGLQVSRDNPIVGLEGRLALLNRLGQVLLDRPQVFGSDPPRIAGMARAILDDRGDTAVHAPGILEHVLTSLGEIWPGRHELGGVNLGDTWRHPGIQRGDASNGLVPFHKLSQWLSYSLVEPLLAAGLEVVDLDGLTGLAEYRNGGLFVDMGVLVPRDPAMVSRPQPVECEFVVEWRALTVALLDELAPLVREHLGCTPLELPLARVLEGGTWAAGRAIAGKLRTDASPPITTVSDGTVF